MNFTKDEWTVFKEVLKEVRREQERRISYNERNDDKKSTSKFIFVEVRRVLLKIADMHFNKDYATLYKLEKDGYVKIKKPTSKYGKSKVQLTQKGVDIVNELKQRA